MISRSTNVRSSARNSRWSSSSSKSIGSPRSVRVEDGQGAAVVGRSTPGDARPGRRSRRACGVVGSRRVSRTAPSARRTRATTYGASTSGRGARCTTVKESTTPAPARLAPAECVGAAAAGAQRPRRVLDVPAGGAAPAPSSRCSRVASHQAAVISSAGGPPGSSRRSRSTPSTTVAWVERMPPVPCASAISAPGTCRSPALAAQLADRLDQQQHADWPGWQ